MLGEHSGIRQAGSVPVWRACSALVDTGSSVFFSRPQWLGLHLSGWQCFCLAGMQCIGGHCDANGGMIQYTPLIAHCNAIGFPSVASRPARTALAIAHVLSHHERSSFLIAGDVWNACADGVSVWWACSAMVGNGRNGLLFLLQGLFGMHVLTVFLCGGDAVHGWALGAAACHCRLQFFWRLQQGGARTCIIQQY